ncbi:CLUMA_CG015956, isoform A [Clunio marinus]|uniref:CLUMA_CG015956, isoform A n=1 Tax=Clunio marinus TaxID=568069 RepID=A0A1J1IRR7_9DIPT|nr:CLUMA_CG015956, isoform A [Clunio marinus]
MRLDLKAKAFMKYRFTVQNFVSLPNFCFKKQLYCLQLHEKNKAREKKQYQKGHTDDECVGRHSRWWMKRKKKMNSKMELTPRDFENSVLVQRKPQ